MSAIPPAAARWYIIWRGTARAGGGRGEKARHYLCGAAVDGKDASQSKWSSQGSFRRISDRARGQSLAILSQRRLGSVLWLQPAGRQAVGGRDRELVAAGHDGRRESALRRHRRVLADRFHRGPEEDQRPGAGDAQRGRSDRSLCRVRSIVGEASEERHAEDVQGLSAR